MTLTKATIIEEIQDQLRFSKKESTDHVEMLLEIMKRTLSEGEDLLISGFGKFRVNEKEPRKGRNPATGQEMILDKRKVVTFKCSGKLKNRLNKK